MSLAYWQSCSKALPQCPPVSFESRHLPLWPTNKHVNAVRKVLGDSINLLLSIIGLWTCSENMRRSGANFTEAMPWTELLSFWLQGRRPCTAVFCSFLILINCLPHLLSHFLSPSLGLRSSTQILSWKKYCVTAGWHICLWFILTLAIRCRITSQIVSQVLISVRFFLTLQASFWRGNCDSVNVR